MRESSHALPAGRALRLPRVRSPRVRAWVGGGVPGAGAAAPRPPLARLTGERMAESEAETPSTPGEFESKYFEYNGVRLPPFCRGKMEEIANFPVRDSDVWIVTYPKSGRRAGGSPPGLGLPPRRGGLGGGSGFSSPLAPSSQGSRPRGRGARPRPPGGRCAAAECPRREAGARPAPCRRPPVRRGAGGP